MCAGRRESLRHNVCVQRLPKAVRWNTGLERSSQALEALLIILGLIGDDLLQVFLCLNWIDRIQVLDIPLPALLCVLQEEQLVPGSYPHGLNGVVDVFATPKLVIQGCIPTAVSPQVG